ncbi:MAG: glycosyltransferase family 2 protein [Selenomonadaceae bacterium]|nr:glycosyltransferase family 2 protein [Selenomonadaceae bacterium]
MRKLKPTRKAKTKLKISACYIVKNEEKTLPRSIDSLKSAVDEIVVIDTGSTDKTIEIAESYGAKVIKTAWNDDFSAPRNLAIDNASGDWIIFLDADEFFAYPDKVRPAIEKFSNETTIIIPRINIDADNDNREINRNNDLRIFRNVDYLRYRGMIHENLENINGGDLPHVYSGKDLTIYHTGYSSTLSEDKFKRNLRILELEVKQYGYRVQQDMSFASCYTGLGDYEKALYYAKRAIKAETPIITNPEAPYVHALKAMYELKYPIEECLKFLDETLQALPDVPFFYDQQGILLEKLKRPKEANISYCKRDIVKVKLDIQLNGHRPQHDAELASCYSDMGDYKNALKYAKAAVKAGYKTDRVYRDIIKSMYMLKKPIENIVKVTTEAIKALPQCPEFYAERAMIMCDNNHIAEGYRELKKSLEVWNKLEGEAHDKSYFARIAGRVYARIAEIESLMSKVENK